MRGAGLALNSRSSNLIQITCLTHGLADILWNARGGEDVIVTLSSKGGDPRLDLSQRLLLYNISDYKTLLQFIQANIEEVIQLHQT